MGLSAGQFIRVGGGGRLAYGCVKMASEKTYKIRQNENLYLKNKENVSYYSSICSFKNIVPEIVPLWLKNRHQVAYTWSNRSVKEKVGLSARDQNVGWGLQAEKYGMCILDQDVHLR